MQRDCPSDFPSKSLVEPEFLFHQQLWEILKSDENPDFPTRAVMRYGLENLWNIPVRSTLLTHLDLYQILLPHFGNLSKIINSRNLAIITIAACQNYIWEMVRSPAQFIFSLVFFHPLFYFIFNSLFSMIWFFLHIWWGFFFCHATLWHIYLHHVLEKWYFKEDLFSSSS